MMNSPPSASVVPIAVWVEGPFDVIPEPAAGKVLVASGVDELLAVDGAGEPLVLHPKNRKPVSETTTPIHDFLALWSDVGRVTGWQTVKTDAAVFEGITGYLR